MFSGVQIYLIFTVILLHVALMVHFCSGKGSEVQSRLRQLFDLVPEIRHIGMWHTEMMKQMKVNIQLHEVHQLLQNVSV